MKTVDVVVIGLGTVGSALTYQLAKRGVRVLGIDRFAPPHAAGSSAGDTRITRLLNAEGDVYCELAKRSHTIWRELEAQSGLRLFEQTGCLVTAPQDQAAGAHGHNDFYAECVAVAERHEIKLEQLDAKQLRSRFSEFKFSDHDIGLFDSAGGVLRAQHCMQAHCDLSRQHGAILQVDVLRSFEEHASRSGVRVELESGEVINAGQLVLVAGSEITEWLPEPLAKQLRLCRQVLWWFELADECPSFDLEHTPSFIRLAEQEEDLIYGMADLNARWVKVGMEQYSPAADRAELKAPVTAQEAKRAYALAAPYLRIKPEPMHHQICSYTVTPHHGFWVDVLPEHECVHVVSACSGHGFKTSAALGEAMAQRLCGQLPDINLESLSLKAFRSGK